MKKNVIPFMLLLLSGAMKGFGPYRKASWELAHLKMSLFYMKGIKTSRLLFLTFLAIGGCLIALFSALVLFHVTLFVYTPWSTETKIFLGFFSAAVYLSIAITGLYYAFSQEKWLRMFHAEELLNGLAEKSSAESSEVDSNGKKDGVSTKSLL